MKIMKSVLKSLFALFDGQEREREIEEELELHLELLARDLMQQKFSSTEARRLAVERFGDVERVRRQCVAIRKKNSPVFRAIKSFLILVFLAGILLRVFSAELNFRHMGDILMIIGIFGRLFIYVRGLSVATARLTPDAPTLLRLTRVEGGASAQQDEGTLTPVERLILDK
jgi:hypothetical protein